MKVQTGNFKTTDARLYYEIAGSGEALVFVHGYGLDCRTWDEQFEAFAGAYRVLRYDLRGFGRSTLPAGERYTHAGDLLALLQHLDIPQAHLVGLSMGSWIVTNFTLNYPQMTRSLTLAGPTLIGYDWSDEWKRLWNEMVVAAKADGPQAANQRWLAHPIFAPAREQAAVARCLAQMIGDYSGWHWVNRDLHRSIRPPDAERLDQIKVPTLILLGERDWPDFYTVASILQVRIPCVQKALIPGVGHLSNMEAAQAFNGILGGFLQSV